MAKTKITKEIAIEIANQISNGEKRVDVYKQYPFAVSSIQYALKKYGLHTLKKKKGSTLMQSQILEHKYELENGILSGYALAKKIGCSAAYVTSWASNLGIKLFFHKGRGRRKTVSDEICQKVLDHLAEHGGTVNSSSRALGMDSQRIQQAVRSYAKRINFDTVQYRIAHQQFGLWKVLPGRPEPCYTADYRVDAECTGCNTVHRVLIGNLRSGASSGCHHCNRYKGNIAVRCKETGDVFKSIHSLSLELELKYQNVRGALKNQGVFEHLGLTYIFET